MAKCICEICPELNPPHSLKRPGKEPLLTELDLKALSDAFRDMGEKNERGGLIVILSEINRTGSRPLLAERAVS